MLTLYEPEENMLQPFTFEAGGRSYACAAEAAPPPRTEVWWWFAVEGDRARYAPFQVSVDDTHSSVCSRVEAYYVQYLARRAAPFDRHAWGRKWSTAPRSPGLNAEPPTDAAGGSGSPTGENP
jgi:hypothetical protein